MYEVFLSEMREITSRWVIFNLLEWTFFKSAHNPKKMTESNSTRDEFNSFSLITITFSSWADFSLLSDLKECTQTWAIWVNSNPI